jgi:hypothetical protein
MPTAKTGEVTILPGSNLTSWDEGLTKAQLDAVEKCVESVATISCKTYKDMAAAFAELKDALPDGNWVKWTNSVELNVGARTIQDLAAANVWLESTAIDDAKIGRLSARALCMIATCTEKKQKQLEARLAAGEILTFKKVKEHVEGTATKDEAAQPVPAAKQIKDLKEQLKQSILFTRAQVAAADEAIKERDALAAQVKELTTLIQQAMESADISPWMKDAMQGAIKPRLLDGIGKLVMRKTSDASMSPFRDAPAAKP